MKLCLSAFLATILFLVGCATTTTTAATAYELYLQQRSSDNTKNEPKQIQPSGPSLLGFRTSKEVQRIIIGTGLSYDDGTQTLSAATSATSSPATLAALKAVNVSGLTTGTVAIVSGHTAANDGGGGLFYYDSGSSAADDNALIIQPNAGSGRWLRIWKGELNARWFGATGDGTTDDTAEIQAMFNWLEANQILYHPTLGVQGAVYFPRGVYRISSSITIDLAYGLKVTGDSAHNTVIRFNTTTGTALNVTSYINFTLSDICIDNDNGSFTSWASHTGSIGLKLDSNGTATFANLFRVMFKNWEHCVYQGGTLSGDTGLFQHVRFTNAKNAWYSRNPMSGIQRFDTCSYDLITVGGINTFGIGTIQFDSPNFVGAGSLMYLVPTFSEWGLASNYIVNNGKMEWTSPNSMWVRTAPANASAAQYAQGTFTFNSCSMSGGDGGNVTATDVIMELCGSMSVQWNGGNYMGALKYWKNNSLSQANPTTYATRATVVFNGASWAPDPATSGSIVIYDETPGSGYTGPTIVWRNCGNLPDLELGNDTMGYSGRTRHAIKFVPMPNQLVGADASPYLNEIDFHGISVRIESVMFVSINMLGVAAGTRTVQLHSDAARTSLIGSVSFTASAGKWNVPLNAEPTTLNGGKLYLRYATPDINGGTWGYWLIEYTCL